MRVSPKLTYLVFGFWLISLGVSAQNTAKFSNQITGSIIDAISKKPISGVQISYKQATTAITDDNGVFTLSVPSYQVSVIAEAAGYQSKEISISGRKELKISLNESISQEITVYQESSLPTSITASNRRTAAAVGASMNDMWSRAIDSPDSYLQGKIAGLNVVRHSGIANSSATLMLRGITSLQATNQPLIIVDNMIYDNNQYGNSLISNYIDNPLANIDIRDISSVTVLKDASAAALYGTKAANGVILITTARAKELGTKIDLAVYGGLNLAPKSLPILGVKDYRTYLSDLYKSSGASTDFIQSLPFMNDDKTVGSYYQYHNDTDWQEKMFANQQMQNVYLKVTGGDNIAKYALSLNFAKNRAALNGSDLSKYGTRFNADLNLSRRLKGVTNLSFSFNEAKTKDLGFSPKTNPIFLSLTKAPFLSDYDISGLGIASPDLSDEDIFNVGNPTVASQVMSASNRSYRFVGTIAFDYELSKKIHLGTNIGILFDKIKENRFVPRRGILSDTLGLFLAENKLGSQTKRLFNLFNDTYLSFNQSFNETQSFSARIGARFLNSRIEQDKILGFNSATDDLVTVGNGQRLLNQINGGVGVSNWLNTYLSLNYNISDKYFLGFNVAMDASSRFGKDAISQGFRIGNSPTALMPALSAAWVVSSENFMANSAFDLLKFRASIGRVGNDDIGNYASRQYYLVQNLLGMQGIVRGNIGNPALQWESIMKTNVGVDASLLNEKVTLSVDVFKNKTTNMLTMETLPSASGITYALTNNGAMDTKGIEASLAVKIINQQSLKWDAALTIGRSNSKLTKLPDDNVITSFGNAAYISKVGQAPNLFYGLVAQGVYASDAEAKASDLKTKLPDGSLMAFGGGDMKFADLNGDKIIDEKDNQAIGTPSPDFFGSFINRITYKNWTFDALCTFVSGNSIYNYTRSALESMSNPNNQTQAVLNRWRGDGQTSNIPKATMGDPMGNARFSSRWIEDGSYFRLRTLTVSYNLPVDRAMLKYLTFYGTVNNAFTLTKYLGYDPEFSATNSLFGQGVDNTLEPMQKSVQLGIKIGL
jgi:TonB-linked SusC/RagA family outer membrane protein